MKILNEYYNKLSEDVTFNPKEYTIGKTTIKATADRLYNNIFDDLKNDSIMYSYVVQNSTGTDLKFDKKFILKRMDVSFKFECLKRYVALFNTCVEQSKKGDIANLDQSINNLKYMIQTLKDLKVWK